MSAWVHTLVLFLLVLVGGAPEPARDGSRSAPAAPDREARARAIVDRAIEAHGGLEAWRHKKDVVFSTTWTHYRAGRPRFSSRYRVMFPTTPGPRRARIEAEENGKPVLMGVSGSRSWFVVGGAPHEDTASLVANRAFVRKAYALLALPFMLDDPGYRFVYDGHEVRGGQDVDRVQVEQGLEPPMLLLFDSSTGRLTGAGSTVSDRPTTMLGDAHDFEVVDGIAIPTSQTYDRVDPATGAVTRALEVTIETVRFDNGLPARMFEPPAAP